MRRFGLIGFLVIAWCTVSGAAVARDRAGDFDFYVLSLSWSPTYCLDNGSTDRIQCGGRPYAFVVHGLWPQYERGFPSDCPSDQPDRVPRRAVDAMLDVMPSPALIRHEWQKHGTCSGLDQADYFSLIRAAQKRVAIPSRFVDVTDQLTVTPPAVEAAFRKANPGIPADGFAVLCDSRRLKEVRVCLTKDLSFRSCPEVDRGACRRPQIVMPPVR
ncbi:ribonuclease T2 [Kaistia soli DSM 19436]|uniref:Ribonuclease T2 n=1 Tax=Kaistia soli DSM 19436 TaxID=1122133 RepID=A0A1M4U9B0_9HYPH|nr:ribonuclease T2 [Kaistia soli]SHE53431.1 ribonuclease T2 [Kaistia soli DSM 19436]